MTNISDWFKEASKSFREGQMALAQQWCQQIVDADPGHADAVHLLGVIASQSQDHEWALRHFSRAVELNPQQTLYHSNLGATLRALGRLDEAIASCRTALQIQPRNPQALNNLGIALSEYGEHLEAEGCYRRSLEIRPQNASTHSNLGNVLMQLGRPNQAVSCYRQAVEIQPRFTEAHNALGSAYLETGELVDAVSSFQAAINLRPDHASAHNNLGLALRRSGKAEEALVCFQRATQLRTDFAEAYDNLGTTWFQLDRPREAIPYYRQATQIRPDFAQAYNNLGSAFYKLAEFADAIANYSKAVEIKPDFAQAYDNLGRAYASHDENPKAVDCYRQAIASRPDFAEAHTGLGYSLLALGAMEEGWREYQWRLLCEANPVPQYGCPQWDGGPLQGRTIMLCPEQGIGDTIQFIRYASEVKRLGASVAVQCAPKLVDLLQTCPGIDLLVPTGDVLPPIDAVCPVMSLPYLMGTTIQSVPASVPYLFCDPDLQAHWRDQLADVPGIRVGIVWQGNPQHKLDHWRSVPLAAFEPLAGVPNVQLISLQKGHGAEQLAAVRGEFEVIELGDRLDNGPAAFLDTAAVMKNIDLVVTSDTATAHLAGALGVPVWVVLCAAPDWRWMTDRADSPWYPSMRLFRQQRIGQWEDVFRDIVDALRDGS